jgi:hypothetical protein
MLVMSLESGMNQNQDRFSRVCMMMVAPPLSPSSRRALR